MRAINQTTFGDPDVLQVIEIERPQPGVGEVLVEVRAIGLNPVEAFIRSGAYPLLGEPPFILGWDVSGVVSALGEGVDRFAVGDEVFGMPLFPAPAAGYAEFVAVPAADLARKPAGLDHVHAAALPLVGLTAWQALHETADLQPGQRVLIHGGGGGVGHVAIQLAKSLGAYVITTASEGKHELVRDLGADEVIDYRAVDFTQVVQDVDLVFDVVGQGLGELSLEVLRPGGLLVTAVDHRSQTLPGLAAAAGRRFSGVSVIPNGASLGHFVQLVEQGRLRTHVDQAWPLEDVAKAHEALTSGVLGKLVLTV